MAKGLFATYHPAVCMLFFLAAICFAFSTMQPVYVALAVIMSSAYLVFLKGGRQYLRSLAMFIPMVVFIGLLNALFDQAGATVLWRWGPFSITSEGLCYGVGIGGMIMSVLLWFSCYSEVMTEDKFTYLFGKAVPTISLMVSMISRWIPRMVSRGRSIYDSQEALIGNYDQSKSGKMARGVRMATVLAGLGMEDSVQTADSMCARGYGTTKRTSYARYNWHTRERVALALLIALVVVNIVLLVTGASSFKYYPRLSTIEPLVGYVTYVLMMAMPFIVELEQLRR